MRYPTVAALPFLHVADTGERHVKTGDEELVGRKHVEDALARRDRFVFIVIHLEVPFRALHGHYILSAGISSDHETLAVTLDMECQQTGRMPGSVDRGDARHDLIAWLDECRTIGQWHADFY